PPDAKVLLLDRAPVADVLNASVSQLLVSTTTLPPAGAEVATYHLQPWGNDELIEYLLATHKERCASVMKRLQPGDRLLFRG
ncbi:hypothetical protein Q8G39_28690, partial [Klebsiella pneumoniae]|uniref:hypothetical protein n=1 Tax=Klebsiella pneumoniae TaxID=573 RepID=UPI00301409C4